ncbi:hypothetical protein E4U21_002656 [Claviceps maximensis]|nr:hypothetical protein E4U21_002656 [Claviceps maximensis]
MVCEEEDLSLMIPYQQFRPTSVEVRRERKRIAQRKYPNASADDSGNNLRLRSEVAQLNNTCEAGAGQLGWHVDLDRKDCEATTRSTSRDVFEGQCLDSADAPFLAVYPTLDLQQESNDDDADADWCCVGSGRDSSSPANFLDARFRHLQPRRELTDYDYSNEPVDVCARRQCPESSPIPMSGAAQPLQPSLFQIPDNSHDANAKENMLDCLRKTDGLVDGTSSSVGDMGRGQASSVSFNLARLSPCQPEPLADTESVEPQFTSRGRSNATRTETIRTAPVHDAGFGWISVAQGSTTTIAGNDCENFQVPYEKTPRGQDRQHIRDTFRGFREPPTSDLTLHEQQDQTTSLPANTAPTPTDSSISTSTSTSLGMSPLFQAAMTGNVKILSIMAHSSAYPEMVNQNGQTILHVAAENGHRDAVEYLIGLGFNINARDSQGNTALHLAISHGWEQIVGILVDAGADVDGLNYK